MLIERVRGGQAHSWANNVEDIGEVEDKLAELKGRLTDFDNECLMVPWKQAEAKAGTAWPSLLESL